MPTPTSVIHLDAERPKISRNLYGHYAERLGRCGSGGRRRRQVSRIRHEGGMRPGLVRPVSAPNIPGPLRPGDCFADEYCRRAGIGPPDQRSRMVDRNRLGVPRHHRGRGRGSLLGSFHERAHAAGRLATRKPRRGAEPPASAQAGKRYGVLPVAFPCRRNSSPLYRARHRQARGTACG